MPIIYNKPTVKQTSPTGYPDNVDFSTFVNNRDPGLDPNWRKISGARAVLERVARAWITVRGEMHDTTIGASLFTYVNATMDQAQIAALQGRLKLQAKARDGVGDINVIVQYNPQSGLVGIQGLLTLANGQTWQFVFSLTADKLKLITLLGPNAG